MWTKETIKNIGQPLRVAFFKSDSVAIADTIKANPWIVADHDWTGNVTWIGSAATKGNIEIVRLLLDLGFNINALAYGKHSALIEAIRCSHDDIVHYLLEHGANPDFDRTLIAAMNQEDPERRMRYVRALVEHGVNVNQLFMMYGDPDNLQTALDWAASFPEAADYLRQHGALTSAELRAKSEVQPGNAAVVPNSNVAVLDEVVAHFDQHIGKSDDRQFIELVRTGHPIAVHFIRPAGERRHLTLFTTGLSIKPMHVPPGEEAWRYAELYIELPGDWQFENMNDPACNWPVLWLRQIAQYPHDHQTSLGGPLALFANGEPPAPLSPGSAFTTFLLTADSSFSRQDGETVHLYRLTPLYTDERELEMREGARALLRAFHRKNVPFIVDMNRASVV